jgi:hypothetical protein
MVAWVAALYVGVWIARKIEGPPKARIVSVSEMTNEERLQAACEEVSRLDDQMSGRDPTKIDLSPHPVRPELQSLHEMACGW